MYDLVHSEKEAQELVAICQKEYQNVDLTIRLSRCAHGMINFNRTAVFGNHGLADRDDLIEKMMSWEFMKKHNISRRRVEDAFYPRHF